MNLRLPIVAILTVVATLDFGAAQQSVPAPSAGPANTTTTPKKAGKKVPPQSAPASVAGSVPDAPPPSDNATKPLETTLGETNPGQTLPAEPALTDAPSQLTDAKPVPAASQAAAPAPASGSRKHSAVEDNPFPEEYSKQAADVGEGNRDGNAPASKAGETESSGSTAPGESSSQQGLEKLDLYGDKGKKSKTRRDADPDAGLAYDPKLAAQDDKIGELYLKSGNAPGAYSRFKEATQHDAGDATAIFGLAESARQLNLLEEAAQAYQTYLFAFPDGSKARVARRALAELRVQQQKK